MHYCGQDSGSGTFSGVDRTVEKIGWEEIKESRIFPSPNSAGNTEQQSHLQLLKLGLKSHSHFYSTVVKTYC